jgi:hypothetical protein
MLHAYPRVPNLQPPSRADARVGQGAGSAGISKAKNTRAVGDLIVPGGLNKESTQEMISPFAIPCKVQGYSKQAITFYYFLIVPIHLRLVGGVF